MLRRFSEFLHRVGSMLRHLCLLILLLPVCGCSQKGAPETILVGHIAPLSGPDRALGEQERQAIVLALEADQQDPIVPNRKLSVIHVDDRGTIAQAQAEATRLITLNRVVGLLGGEEDAEAEKLASTIQPYGVTLVTPASLASVAGLSCVYSSNVTPRAHGRALAQFAADQLKAKRAVVLVEDRNAYCNAVAAAIVENWPGEKPDQVKLVPFDHEPRADPLGQRLARETADVLLFAGSAKNFRTLHDQLKVGKQVVPFVFAGENREWLRLQADPSLCAGVYAASLYSGPEEWSPKQKEFVASYQKRFRTDPGVPAFQAYEGARLLFEGLRHAKGSVPKTREELGKLRDFASFTGALAMHKQHASRPLYIVQQQKEKLTTLKTYEPQEK